MLATLAGPPSSALKPEDVSPTARAARLHREQQLVVAPAFVPVARSSELSAPGAFAATEVAGVPVAAVRQEGGGLAAFVNVCIHRGAQVLREERGRVDGSTFGCPYHGFTYGRDGALTSCPVPDSFPADLRPGRAGMERLPVDEALGWVWVRVGAGEGSVRDWLGAELLSELENYALESCRTVDARSIPCEFDWKIGVEAFLEPLHVPTIHTRSAHPVVDFRAMTARRLGRHSGMTLPFRLDRAFEPDGFIGQGAHAADVRCFPGLDAVQRRSHLTYLIHPYTILALFPNHLMALRFEPTEVGRCVLRYELLAEPPRTEAAAEWLGSLRPGYDRLLEEDLENLPWIERGVASGRAGAANLSSFEVRIEWFNEALDAALGAG